MSKKIFKLPKNTQIITKRKSFKKIKSVAHDIWIKDFTLSDEFCDDLIKKFEAHKGHHEGVTGGGLNKEVKDTLDLGLQQHVEFENEIPMLQQEVCKGFREMLELPEFKYIRKQDNKRNKMSFVESMEHSLFIENDGYQMQKYTPGGKYIYHHEQGFSSIRNARRTLVYTFYINDDFKNGCTHFPRQGVAVEPKKGRLVLFDSSWSNTHAGMEVTEGNKYIVTGWCLGHFTLSEEESTHIYYQLEQQQKQKFLEWQQKQR